VAARLRQGLCHFAWAGWAGLRLGSCWPDTKRPLFERVPTRVLDVLKSARLHTPCQRFGSEGAGGENAEKIGLIAAARSQ